jgi:thioredoxin-dependent peroxiredoxin
MKARLFVLGCLALLACTPSSSGTPAPAATDSTPANIKAASTPSSSAAPAGADALVGQIAPDFTLPAHDGPAMHLSALQGKPVVLYFYPKDETPGCTKEACSFRDSWQAIAKTGATLIGVSADSLESHRAFAEHFKLPFHLVSDPDGAIAKLYGVPFDSVHKRQTIVIGADGKVIKVYRKVDVSVHAQEILSDLGAS